jgi:hypothetical protein
LLLLSGVGQPTSRLRGQQTAALVDVTVHEGTSMAVALSPDRTTLAIDLQGGLWTLPVGGATARRITTGSRN